MYKFFSPLYLVLICFFSTNLLHAGLIDKIMATVNSDVILQSEIQRFEKTLGLRKELDPILGFSDEIEKGQITQKASLEFLILEKLITQTFKITDAEVEQEIQTIQRNNNLDRSQLMDFLKNKGFHFEEYFELLRVGLAKRNLLDREIRSRVNISEDDVKNYFFNMLSKNSTTAQVEYSIQIILINNKSYKTPSLAYDAAQSALKSIKEGESFSEIAKKVSDDESAEFGGELGGFVSPDNLDTPIKNAVKKLQIGNISDLIKTPNGYFIVRLIDVRTAESQKLNESRDEIREILAKTEYKKQLFIWAERAKNSAYIHIN